MSLSLKIGTLVIRTVAKPVSNWIKAQAREHEGFRRRCIAFAQALHRIDMRMKLGLLQDPAIIERQIEREVAKESSAKRSHVPTVPTADEAKAQAESEAKEKARIGGKIKAEEKRKEERRIRPLSDAKAIDSGATFISEAFLFLVAAGLIGFETLRSRRKTEKTRTDFDDRIETLEQELKSAGEERGYLRDMLDELKKELATARAHNGTGTSVATVIKDEVPKEIVKEEKKSKPLHEEAKHNGEKKPQKVKKATKEGHDKHEVKEEHRSHDKQTLHSKSSS